MKRSITFTLFFLLGLVGNAQLPHFDQHDVLKNARSYDVHFTYQDVDGFIWFGTNEGCIQFDGLEYKNFTMADSLYTNEISALAQDTSGTFWIGHSNGKISKGLPGNFKKWKPEEGLPIQQINCFHVDQENNIWFGTAGEGVYYFDHRRVNFLSVDEGLSDNFVYRIKQDRQGRYWIATDYGLNIYDKEEDEISLLSMKDGLPDNIVKDFHFIDSLHVLIGTEDEGIILLNLADTSFLQLVDWSFGSINNFVVLEDEIWISTKRNGLVRLNKKNNNYNVRQFARDEGLFTNRTNHIAADREGNLWIAARKGVIQNASSILAFLDKNDGLIISNIYNFLIDTKNTYWIANENGVSLMQKDEKGNNVSHECFISKELEDKAFVSLYEDSKGYVWLGTYGYGVFRVSPDHKQVDNFRVEDGLGNNNVISISGKQNVVLFSTLGGGLSIFNYNQPGEMITIDTENGLPSNYLYTSYIDSQNRIWLAMDGGLAYFKDNKVVNLDKLNELSVTEFFGIAEDIQQNIWVTTASQGVIKYTNDSISFYTTENGLHSNAYSSIIFDGKDKIVLVSESGLELIDIHDHTISFYGKEFGYRNFEPVLNAIFQDKASNIWITGKNAILKYNTAKAYKQKTKPLVLMTSKKVFFENIPANDSLFNYAENHFTFNYTGLWYKAPERILYRHKLENYDLNWSQPNNLKSVTYSNLAPGTYTFRLQVANETGDWYESENTTYTFTIRPPFWKTWWFITFSIVLLIATVYFIIIYRTRALEKAKDELEEEVRKRTTKIQHQKEEIEAQRDEIEKKNEDIVDSIQYASRIQTAVIPPLDDLTSVFKDAFILNKPRDIVSGDFYWFAQRDNLIFLAAADCTGHGVPGAFMSMLGIASLNEIVNSTDCKCDAAFILNRLRNKIKTSLRQEGKIGEAKDGMDIAFCIIDLHNMEINYAGAYNPLWLIRDGELQVYKADSMPIGVHLNDKKDFKNNTIALQPNDHFYVFSDGYVDQFGGDKGRKFLSKNLKNLLLDIHTLPFDEQRIILDDTIEKWRGHMPQIDDILMIGFKI